MEIQQLGPAEMRILDRLGRQVYQRSLGQLEQGHYSMELVDLNLSSGTYWVEVRDAAGNRVQKQLVVM